MLGDAGAVGAGVRVMGEEETERDGVGVGVGDLDATVVCVSVAVGVRVVEVHGEGVEETERERAPEAVTEMQCVTLLVKEALEVVLGHPVMLPVTLLLDEALTEKVTDELPQLEAADEGDTMAAEDAPPEGLTL